MTAANSWKFWPLGVLVAGVMACRSVEVPQPALAADAATANANAGLTAVDSAVGSANDAAAEGSSDASTPTPDAAGGDAASPAPEVREVFHLPVEPDERNLVLEPDGTFFWEIYGCDFSGGGCGTWSTSGTNLVLTPKAPAKLVWPTSGVGPVTNVVLSRKGTNLEARVTDVSGKVSAQTWLRGEVCATCGGGLGPTGKLKACNKPLTKPCP